MSACALPCVPTLHSRACKTNFRPEMRTWTKGRRAALDIAAAPSPPPGQRLRSGRSSECTASRCEPARSVA